MTETKLMTEAEAVRLCNAVRKAAYCEIGIMLACADIPKAAALVMAWVEHEYPEEAEAA